MRLVGRNQNPYSALASGSSHVSGQEGKERTTALISGQGDRVTFGNLFRAGAPVPYQQETQATHSVTLENPVSKNNCQICSVKHLLRYYQIPPETIDRILETGLKPYLLEMVDVPNNPGVKMHRGLFQSGPNQYDILPEALKDFLTQRLGMKFEAVTLGRQNTAEQDATQFWDQCATVRAASKPLLMGLGYGAPNPLGGSALGHAIFAYPVNGTDSWHFVDSEKTQIEAMTGDKFDDYVFENAKTHPILISKVVEGPKDERVAQFKPDSASDLKPVKNVADVSELSVESTDSDVPDGAKDETQSPIQPKKWYQRLGQWIQTQWQGLVSWIKSWFSGKKA